MHNNEETKVILGSCFHISNGNPYSDSFSVQVLLPRKVLQQNPTVLPAGFELLNALKYSPHIHSSLWAEVALSRTRKGWLVWIIGKVQQPLGEVFGEMKT